MTLDWQPERLQAQLHTLLPGIQVQVVAEIGSTNTTLLERARNGDATPMLLAAELQNAGRGRLGRGWWAAVGDSLTFSIALPYAPVDWSGLSLAVGLAVAEALDPTGEHIGLKWPNDLWLRHEDRKLAGILIETTAWRPTSGQAVDERWVVIGIGVNIAERGPQPGPQTGAFNTGYAGLREWVPALDAPAALHRIAPAVLAMLQQFGSGTFSALRERFGARDVLLGRTVQAGETRGRMVGLDPQGQLLIETDVCLVTIGSGEVSVRPC
ncbi:MAG: biotin--[acetyl-CoA-carboxylase] ligase [Burkholderiales bacterium]